MVPWELPENFTQLITEAVRDGGYPLRGIVSDMRAGFWRAWEDYFARVPYQACRVHFDRRIEYEIGPRRGKGPKVALASEFSWLYLARGTAHLYMTFHSHPELPADNNITENVIKQLGKKLRLMSYLVDRPR